MRIGIPCSLSLYLKKNIILEKNQFEFLPIMHLQCFLHVGINKGFQFLKELSFCHKL